MLNSSPVRECPLYAQRAGRDVRLLVVMRFIRLHPGAQKGSAANYWSLFEPHYKQNLSANPKRTAKSSFYISDAPHLTFVQIIFQNPKIYFSKNADYRNNLSVTTTPFAQKSFGVKRSNVFCNKISRIFLLTPTPLRT
jgi:hypothetical protein